jgi:hypothetical protein
VRSRRCFESWVLGLGGVLCLALPAAADVEVRTALEPAVIGIDETATFRLEVRGDDFSSLRFHPSFELDNLEIVGGPSRYEDMRFVNGSFSRTLRLSWQVRPLGLGEARVRSISAQLDDEVRQLPAQVIRVQREPTQQRRRPFGGFGNEEDPFQQFFGRMNPWRRQPQGPEVFLRAEIQPQRPVVGQQVLFTLYLYTREDINSLSPSGVPTFRGFWVQDIQLPQQLPTEMVEVDGRRYGKVPLLRKALFPLRAGRYKVEPATVDLTVQRYDRRFAFSRPIARPEQLRLTTESQWIDVQPLPPAPPSFGGAVGQLALTAELEPRQIRLGEAATLTVRLSGAGNLQGIRDPGISPPSGVTVFPPQQEGMNQVSGTTVRGNRTWRYVIVAERAGRYMLQTPDIPYFDPESRRYQVAVAPDLALTALPRATDATSAGDGGVPHGIRMSALGSAVSSGRRWRSLLPWLFALPWGLALVVTLARRRNGVGRPPQTEGSAAGRTLDEGLRQAETEARPRRAAAHIEDAWRGLLAERWNIPEATPPTRWREMLAARGADPDIVDEMGHLVEDLQYLRCAPQLSATDCLRDETLGRCRRLLRRLR